eukprot:3831520-Rhodomonas_salina.1
MSTPGAGRGGGGEGGVGGEADGGGRTHRGRGEGTQGEREHWTVNGEEKVCLSGRVEADFQGTQSVVVREQ